MRIRMMQRVRRVGMMVAGLVVMLVGGHSIVRGGEAKAQELQDLAEVFPASTILYVTADDLAGAKVAPKNMTAWQHILAEPGMKEFLKEPLARLDNITKKIEIITPFTLAGLKSTFGKRAALGLVFNPAFMEFGVIIVGEAADEAAATKTCAAMLQLVKQYVPGAAGMKPTEKDGITTLQAGLGWLSMTRKDGRLYIAFDTTGKTLETMLALPVEKSLARSALYRDTVKELGANRPCLVYGNLTRIWQMMGGLAMADKETGAIFTQLQGMGVTDIQSVGYALGQEDKGYRGRLFMNVPQPRRGTWANTGTKPIAAELLAAVPHDAGMLSASTYEYAQALAPIRAQLGEKAGSVDEGLAKFKAISGLDLEKDLLAHLGSGAAFVMQRGARLGGIPLFGLNAITLIIETKNPAAMRTNLQKLAQLGGQFIAATPFGGGLLQTGAGQEAVTGLRIANVITPSFAVTDKFVILASSPDAVRGILNTISGKTKNITTNQEFQALAKKLRFGAASTVNFAPSMQRGGGISLAIVLGAATLAFAEDFIVTTFDDEGRANPRAFERKLKSQPLQVLGNIFKAVQLYKIPAGESLGRHLFASGSSMRMTEKGFLLEGFGPLPLGQGLGQVSGGSSGDTSTLTSVAVVSIIAAIAIPNLLESRMTANEANAVAALKQFATAQAIYKKVNYAGIAANQYKSKYYAPSFQNLGGAKAHVNGAGTPTKLLSRTFTAATNAANAYQGYYFMDAKLPKGARLYDFGLWAVPAVYGKSGVNTYYINGTGIVKMKDLGGKLPAPDKVNLDNTWVMP